MKTLSNQITPGMIISLDDQIYRVESSVKFTVAKGVPFIKTKLKNLITGETIEKNFKVDQEVQEVKLAEKRLEYLYLDGNQHLFLDIDNLEQVMVAKEIISEKVNFLKEGVIVQALFYGDKIYSLELPQFLELMVVKTEDLEPGATMFASNKIAVIETGARIEVPMFIESGDIVKVDTTTKEYVQRV
ncbi:MAG: elongation factor P [Chlamydiae bacterium]|nr:elongation factor P [Chlamydiota bacterium]